VHGFIYGVTVFKAIFAQVVAITRFRRHASLSPFYANWQGVGVCRFRWWVVNLC
jgi:hypothetical protein